MPVWGMFLTFTGNFTAEENFYRQSSLFLAVNDDLTDLCKLENIQDTDRVNKEQFKHSSEKIRLYPLQ